MPEYEQAVFISYAWGGEREDIVNQIDETLQKRGVRIVRDKRALGYRGSIKEFMERIGRGNCVILVISDKYLRSPNCMFELVETAENKQFHDRIFPIVLSDANIYDPIKRIEYVKHWEAKRAELAKAMKKLDPANLQGIRDDMDLYDRIRDRISGITSILKDMNTLTPDMHRDSDFSDLYDAIAKRMEENPVISAAESNQIANKVEVAEAKPSAKQTAARNDVQSTASDQFESERQIVVKASALLMQGKQLLEKKDWSGAAQIFRQVLILIPNHAETMKLLSNAEAQIQQERESIARIIEQQNAEKRSTQADIQLEKEKVQHPGSTPVAPANRPIAEKPETELSSGKESTRNMSGEIKPPKNRFSRKSIMFGGIAFLLVTSGVIGAAISMAGKNLSPVTSVGMVNVPSGSYTIDTNSPVELAGFWVDRYEITNSNYAKFIEETESDPPKYWVGGDIPAGLRKHPVTQITWDQAVDYCAWAGKRLPTEEEWEIAARGPFGWKYPWGNDPDKVRQETKGTRPVDSNPANRSYFGAYYMSGNVWEWVSDPFTPSAENEHVMRGGAYGPLDVLTTAISIADNSPANEKAGFRCAASGDNVTRIYDEALALDDNFEISNTNWPGIHEDNFLFDYHEVGYYHVEATEPNKFIPAFYAHDTYSNFVMETGVFVDRANTDNQQGNFLYGLGIQPADDQFYAFVISAKDQNWQVLKGTLNPGAVIGDVSDLTVIKSGIESSIRGASEELEDRLTVIVNNTELSYYVNGNLVHVVTVENHQKVKVGFIVETLDDVTRVHIHFNWVTLQNIEPFDS
jgi:formylglycine-generating enzyme required for sulfatase activity